MFIQQFAGVFAKYLEVLLHLMLMIASGIGPFIPILQMGKLRTGETL